MGKSHAVRALRTLVLAVILGMVFTSARAQSSRIGLLVVDRADADVAAGVAGIQWRGPVQVIALAPDAGREGDWADAMRELRTHRASAVVVVVVPGVPGLRQAVARLMVAERGFVHLARDPSGRDATSIATAAQQAAWRLIASGQVDEPHQLRRLNVTATRDLRPTFRTSVPVTVLDAATIRERNPNNAADLLRDVSGLGVDGVGTTQRRPIIRGVEGLRVLVLEDGLRLNNTRRRTDFGEIPALVDPTSLQRIEVIRGPSSVLYGSDAIGGVLNLVTTPPSTDRRGVRGSVGYRFSSADGQNKVHASGTAAAGWVAVRAAGSFRSTRSYDAPAGSFGDVSLARPTRVHDTGVRDFGWNLAVDLTPSDVHRGFLRLERYGADDAGFGYVRPSDLGAEGPTVQLLFPRHEFSRLSAGYRGERVDLPIADRVTTSVYWQGNRRDFVTNVTMAMAVPGSELHTRSENFTDIASYGGRLEASKAITGSLGVTYGLDLFEDRSNNTDSSTTTITGMGPSPIVRGSGAPRVPNASLRAIGVFGQAEWLVGDRVGVMAGLRYQGVDAWTRVTEGLSLEPSRASDRSLVGTVNGRVELADGLHLVGNLGTGFRSPNLIERFYTGKAPSGRGEWISNPDLRPERSRNVDLGFRYRSASVSAEVFAFHNLIRDGIHAKPTGNEVNGVPEYQNVNVERVRFRGVEASGEMTVAQVVSLRAGYTWLDPRDLDEPDEPLGDTYTHRWSIAGRVDAPDRRWWAEYAIRHNGRRDEVELGISPVGSAIPAFTVHTVRAGLTPLRGQRVTVAVENLTNRLYAEATNVAFFRPEPGRNVVLSWTMMF